MSKQAEAQRQTAFEGGADPDAFRVLDGSGRLVEGAESPLGPKEVIEAYRWMLFSRALDERAVSLQRQGRIGTYSAVYGQEASVVGVAMALDPSRDWIVPQYRETPALLRHGMPLSTLFLYYIGNPLGARVPEGVLLTPIQIALAAQLPHAVGLAMGLKLQRRPGVVATYCGDGASSEGDFHEALNLAGVTRAPVVFVVQNNGYAISTSRSRQTAAKSFASRAEGYGLPGVRVDGNDLLAVAATAREAVARASAGNGPTLIEAQTYRLYPHNTADDQTRYVPPEELEQRWKEDPIPRMRAYLQGCALLDETGEQEMLDEIADQISNAVADAESRARPSPDQVFEHVYVRPWSRVLRQREETARGNEGGGDV
ncbi:MAG: thiamine pyrophosphate-dependent dehydrogenase E1 component subunit alpha [Acidimicrobiales bacterium]